jgi:hypothetical protein
MIRNAAIPQRKRNWTWAKGKNRSWRGDALNEIYSGNLSFVAPAPAKSI